MKKNSIQHRESSVTGTAKSDLLALPLPSFILGCVGDPQGRQIMYQNCLWGPV